MTDIAAQELNAAYERGVATGRERERKNWEDAIAKMTAKPFEVQFHNAESLHFQFGIQWRKEANELVGTVALMERKA